MCCFDNWRVKLNIHCANLNEDMKIECGVGKGGHRSFDTYKTEDGINDNSRPKLDMINWDSGEADTDKI